ncbi:hypothetical protein Hamer_G002832 [Homarus americanus]|uniref:Uncharacterized protein n=1 Tax=Homarus americanus TaxID=6706 RepID=A0A8J5JYD9_HOMAM|nr:hypothetical protein Hamer_G002832 [Homarus americanus]
MTARGHVNSLCVCHNALRCRVWSKIPGDTSSLVAAAHLCKVSGCCSDKFSLKAVNMKCNHGDANMQMV